MKDRAGISEPLPPILVAPTEPACLSLLGRVSSTPERWGVDFWWRAVDGKFCGIQRKAFPGDFVASVTDGRLGKELGQMLRLSQLGGFAGLIIEGQPRWDEAGNLVSRFTSYHRDRFDAIMASIQLRYGVSYWITEDLDHTARLLLALHQWTQSKDHSSLSVRPKAPKVWGLDSRTEQQSHFLQGLPACGDVRAKAVLAQFGAVPMAWTITEQQLRAVPGIGKGTAGRWFHFLGGVTNGHSTDG
jgi:ERCC4-type nuclease